MDYGGHSLGKARDKDFHYALSSLWVKAHTCPLGSCKSLVLRNCGPQPYPYWPCPWLPSPVFLEKPSGGPDSAFGSGQQMSIPDGDGQNHCLLNHPKQPFARNSIAILWNVVIYILFHRSSGCWLLGKNFHPFFFFLLDCRSLNSRFLHPQRCPSSSTSLSCHGDSQAFLETSIPFSGVQLKGRTMGLTGRTIDLTGRTIDLTGRTMDQLCPHSLPACPGVCFKNMICLLVSVCLSSIYLSIYHLSFLYLFFFQPGLETKACFMLVLGKKHSCTEPHPSLEVRLSPQSVTTFTFGKGARQLRRIVM